MPTLIRSASLSGYVELARSLGLDPYRLMREAGLDRSCLADPDTRVAARSVGRLLEASARAAGVEDFGLRLAESRRLSNLGPISLVVREEPTARKSLETLGRYLRLHNESLFARIEDADSLALIKAGLTLGESEAARQAMQLVVGVLFRLLRELLGESWEARRVCFSHRAPASLASHVRVFGRFVEFGCEFDGVVCRSAELDAPRPAADPVMARHARQYLDLLAARPDDSTRDKVRQQIQALLPAGQCTVERVAQHLGMDRRTLHRHLSRDRETFSSLIDAARAELAVRYVANRDQKLADVATLLGFNSQSAFARWFRGKFGASVSAWRVSPREPELQVGD